MNRKKSAEAQQKKDDKDAGLFLRVLTVLVSMLTELTNVWKRPLITISRPNKHNQEGPRGQSIVITFNINLFSKIKTVVVKNLHNAFDKTAVNRMSRADRKKEE